eukprot:Pompholyxophrys_punicea_v1_NODE_39_length_4727_cov_10.240848.p3 type:complete len:153 gc:universal NODE_39_length_4727_cov_10.240848:1457-1915(+)
MPRQTKDKNHPPEPEAVLTGGVWTKISSARKISQPHRSTRRRIRFGVYENLVVFPNTAKKFCPSRKDLSAQHACGKMYSLRVSVWSDVLPKKTMIAFGIPVIEMHKMFVQIIVQFTKRMVFVEPFPADDVSNKCWTDFIVIFPLLRVEEFCG